MTDFWKDRATSAAETGAHLTGEFNSVEAAISHLSFAAVALAPMALSLDDRLRVLALVDKITTAIR